MSAFSSLEVKRPVWPTVVIFTLAFWLSASLMMDLVIMPGMYASGMMTQAGFATAGYMIFWVFNRIELLCAALVLTGALVLDRTHFTTGNQSRNAIILSSILITIALVCTYFLSPEMSALGLNLNLFEPVAEVPGKMNLLHEGYWALEVLKLVAGGAILSLWYQANRN
ncbi:DUF4149 domain-containing protein [Argonema antarcticum]|uniref:DUF4149 domain-containing protein n=1 Tax=Argonema antarcticum TaxID=2942763 RepID=UPI002011BF64|nr:DUF4149 domain-containing protein [Argonema antarcticum]MCL1475149.1 DUF4149 domain-containing protein [Argonema antarcticum A004/B2]